MKYRIEYTLIGAESAGTGRKEFDADSDHEATSRMRKICLEVQAEVNRNTRNKFWHYSVEPRELVRIEQPEVSTPIVLPT